MKHLTTTIISLILMSFLTIKSEEHEVEWFTPSFNGSMEFGQIVKGKYRAEPDKNYNGQFIPRLGVSITQHAIVEEKLDIRIGVGGLFWYSFPETGNWWEVGTKFGPGISAAQAKYTFGDAKNTTSLKLGLFSMKYNPDASNLGEYLYRSRPYPQFLMTGKWGLVNSASYFAQGLHFHIENFDGALQHDLTLFMERDFWPNNDFTPGYLLTYKKGMLEIGGGVAFQHLIPIKPSRLKTPTAGNHYIEYQYFPATIDKDSLARPTGLLGMPEFDWNDDDLRDATGGRPIKDSIFVSLTDRTQFVYRTDPLYIANPAGYESIENHKSEMYYTHRGTNLMARASLDFKKVSDIDFKIFLETALLGVKNYPFFYENRMERIPVMAGMNIPTGGLLDIFTIQVEYFNSPWANSLDQIYTKFAPVPGRQSDDNEVVDKDNFHWSVMTKKNLVPGASIYLQVASDHLRLIRWNYASTSTPLTSKSNEWYYIIKMEFGI